MRTIRTILLLFSVLFILQPALSQEKYSKVKIYLQGNANKKQDIISLLQIDHYTRQDNAIIAEISATDLVKLRGTSYQFEILIDDVTSHFQDESRRFFTDVKAGRITANEQAGKTVFDQSCKRVGSLISVPSFFSTTALPPGSMGGFYTLAEMNAEMDQLVSSFPGIVEKFSIGNSVEGRPIWCIKISDNVASDEGEPEILYLGLQHAREAIGGTSLIFFAQYLAQNYATDQRVNELVNNRAVFIIPCVNPDGYERNRRVSPGGGGMQRKNRRKNTGADSTGAGVDLNRNYGVDWHDCAGASSSCGSGTADAETYWGTSAFSEPETRAVRDFCYSRNFVIAFDQHCAGPYYSLPFGRRAYHTMTPMEQDFYTYVPALMGKYNGHRAGDSKATVAYEVAGGAKDWWLLGDIESFPGEANKKGKIYGMTGEAGGGDFWAPSSSIIELCKNLCYQNLQLALVAGSYVDLQDAGDIALSTRNGSFSFSVRKVGLGNSPINISLIPIENIQSVGTPVDTNLPNYFDVYKGGIDYTLSPALSDGQRIRFAWKVETGGITTYDTVVKIYNAITLLADNMEGSFLTNWVSSSDVSGTAGNWAFTSSYSFSGSKSLTESPSGNYTGSTTRTVTYSNSASLDLGNATAAYLSFWVRHRAENFRDRLLIQVSTDGTSWTSLCGKNTVSETSNIANEGSLGGVPSLTGIREEWTREVIDLSVYNGIADLGLRFRFISDPSPADPDNDFEQDLDDGFYIDDVKLVKSTNPLSVLPVNFISFTGRLLSDETVRLDWQAETDELHDHFEVEKSADGTHFISIARGPSFPPYYIIDPRPFIGNSFYRIKQVDKDGTITYSSTVHIRYNTGRFNISIYPNPVRNTLYVKFSGVQADRYTISMIDMAGRVLYREQFLISEGSKELPIILKQPSAQFYLLQVRNSRNELVAIEKVMKE